MVDRCRVISKPGARYPIHVCFVCARRRPDAIVSRRAALDEIKKAEEASSSASAASATSTPALTEEDLEPALLQRALLTAFPSGNSCMLWTPKDWHKDCQLDRAFPVLVKNFPVKPSKSTETDAKPVMLADLTIRSCADYRLWQEKAEQHSYLRVHPPLSLKSKPKAPVRHGSLQND